MRYLLTLCLFLASLSLLSAQGWVRKYNITTDSSILKDVVQGKDSCFYLATVNIDFLTVGKISKNGALLQTLKLPDIIPPPAYGFPVKVTACENNNINVCRSSELEVLNIYQLDTSLKVLWRKDIKTSLISVKSSNDGLFFITKEFSGNIFKLLNISYDGVIKSDVVLAVPFVDFEIVEDGIIGITNDGIIAKCDFAGKLLYQNPTQLSIGYPYYYRIIKLGNNEFLLSLNGYSYEYYKIDKNANIIWKRENLPKNIGWGGYAEQFVNNNGNFIVFESHFHHERDTMAFMKYNSFGDTVKSITFNDNLLNKSLILKYIKTYDNYLIYFGSLIGGVHFAVKVDTNGVIFNKKIYGSVSIDANKDCTILPNEKGLAGVTVNINSVQDNFKTITDKYGKFEVSLNNGIYTVSPVILGSNKYWSNCTPSVSATVADGKAPDTVKFSIKPLISAPLMQVDITTPFLRRCFSNTYYVQYCNKGTTLAQNAFVDITLDSLLEYQGATLPLKSKTGNIYRFNLGNADINDCGRFEITARVRCGDSTRLNQTLCVKAKIYPDTTGTPTTSWSGANITIKGGCIGDTAVFTIKNEGTAASKSLKAKTYINEDVYEGFNVQLPAGGVMTKKYKSDKKTWRITSDQEPNHPNSTRPTAFVEPCSNEPILSLQSPAMAFSADDYALSLDEDCQPIRGAYDPNDKAGYPFGKKSIGQIPANQDLEYLIRFQNTGTDTAFTVVIKDTLPLTLDPTTIEWGTSSHPYTPSFEGKNTVIFTFNNILLVDSFTNEPKSHGFVRFRIKQMPNLLNGTKIQNSAGIYFDFNPPIITNKTLHTIGADEFLSPVIETAERANTIIVSPNPFTDKTHFKLENPLLSTGQLEIFDLNGRLLQTEVVKGQEFDFNKKNLKSGIYIFKITENGQIVGQGKIAVQ